MNVLQFILFSRMVIAWMSQQRDRYLAHVPTTHFSPESTRYAIHQLVCNV